MLIYISTYAVSQKYVIALHWFNLSDDPQYPPLPTIDAAWACRVGHDIKNGHKYWAYSYPEAVAQDRKWFENVDDEFQHDVLKQSRKFKLECHGKGSAKKLKIVPPYPQKVGASSLYSSTLRYMVDNIDQLTTEAIEWLPKRLVVDIFTLISSR